MYEGRILFPPLQGMNMLRLNRREGECYEKFGERCALPAYKKFGAMLGDEVEVGCGTVLNPGSVVGSHTNIYPLSSVRGYVPAGSIYKRQGEVVDKIME